jgi:hypothetical protein
MWAGEIVRQLNRRLLPRGYVAEATVNVGSQVQVDVGTFEAEQDHPESLTESNGGGVAVQTWAPPAPPLILETSFADTISVHVFQTDAGAKLVGAIELVSPRNKDRPASRAAFAAKCAAYLQEEIGLIVVDIVTERRANLHDELMGLLETADTFAFPSATSVYAVAYRSRVVDTQGRIELWPYRLEVGQPLPVLPLAVRGLGALPIDLETTYTTTCHDTRIGD